MIRLIKKVGTASPGVLVERGSHETQLLIDSVDAGNTDLTFKSSIYGHEDVKSSLIDLQNYKCCFCESKIGHISYGDVEHYRPKGGWVQDDEELNQPGYYWLAYDWDNLLLSCQKCNQRFKKNFFPLEDSTERRISTRDISQESPVFVHPVHENPEDIISFREEIPVAINGNIRGDQTIKKLGLDRELLNEQRREKLNMVRTIYNLAKGYPEVPEKQRARTAVKEYYDKSQLDSTEYASMLRAFFREHPIDF